MSDQDQPAPGEPSFEDPAFDDLRGLLAGIRETEGIPAEVADRLDATLGSLRDQRRADLDRRSAPVLVLRRRVGRVLVAAAAAAVIVAGSVGILHSSRDGGSADESATSSAGGSAHADKAAPGLPSPDALAGLSATGAARLRTADFAGDAAALMRTWAANAAGGTAGSTPAAPTPAPSGSLDTRDHDNADGISPPPAPPVTATPGPLTTTTGQLAACAGPAAPHAIRLAATLDGVPVALLFRAPTTSGQRVEAWSCNGSTLLASAVVPR